MREGVAADDRLVGLHRLPGQLREQPARPDELRGVDRGRVGHPVGLDPRRHDDLLERGVARALPDAVDGALHLAHPGPHRGQRVGHRQAEVVVAVRAEDDAPGAAHPAAHLGEELLDLLRRAVADRVGQVDGGRPGGDGGLDDPAQEADVAAGRVLGRELHVVRVAPGPGHAVGDRLQAVVPADPQLALQVQVGGGDEGVDAGALRRAERLAGPLDVGGVAAREGGDHRAPDLPRDQLHRVRVVVGRDREARLDDVGAQRLDLAREPDLLVRVHGEAGRLLAVAQGGVEDDQSVLGHGAPA